MCLHVQLCVLTKSRPVFLSLPPQGRSELLCLPYKWKTHNLAVLTCYPKVGSHIDGLDVIYFTSKLMQSFSDSVLKG